MGFFLAVQMLFMTLFVGATTPAFATCLEEQIQMLQLRSAELPIEKMNYTLLGQQNKETVVLIHGLSSSQDTWAEVAPDLAKDYRVLIYDVRGHGKTEAAGEIYSSTVLAEDLERLMDHLGIQRAHLVGHSMGARTAIRFSELFPERTGKIVFEDMHMKGRSKPLPIPLELARKMKSLPEVFSTPEEAARDLLQYYEPKQVSDMVRNLRQVPGGFSLGYHPWVNLLYSPQGLQEDFSEALKVLKSQFLFLAADAEKGAVLFGIGIDHLKGVRPDAHVVSFPGAGHSIHRDQKDKFLQTVRTFLAGT